MIQFAKISIPQWDKDVKEVFDNDKDASQSYQMVQIPKRSTLKSSGYDFHCPYNCVVPAHGTCKIYTGIKIYLDDNKTLKLYPRSSVGIKHGIMLSNTVGIIDADYVDNPDNEGHIIIALRNLSDEPFYIKAGDKIVQGIIERYYTVDDEEYSDMKERTGGIGSTGR